MAFSLTLSFSFVKRRNTDNDDWAINMLKIGKMRLTLDNNNNKNIWLFLNAFFVCLSFC